MEFFKKLFGGGGQAPAGDKVGLYFYVRPTGCHEVVQVRINLHNDLSLADDNKTYFVHKSVRGTGYKCTRTAELELAFDSNRKLTSNEVSGGALVTEAEYEEWVASQQVGA
jgi:hypothetical protein